MFCDIAKTHAHDDTVKEYAITPLMKIFSFQITAWSSAIHLIKSQLYIKGVENGLKLTMVNFQLANLCQLTEISNEKAQGYQDTQWGIIWMVSAVEDFGVSLLKLKELHFVVREWFHTNLEVVASIKVIHEAFLMEQLGRNF